MKCKSCKIDTGEAELTGYCFSCNQVRDGLAKAALTGLTAFDMSAEPKLEYHIEQIATLAYRIADAGMQARRLPNGSNAMEPLY